MSNSSKRYVSYLRVSTTQQGHSGLGLEAQRKAVGDYLNGIQSLDEVVEIESGKKNDRPELARALRICRLKRATLVIAKLDRLARNVKFIATLMEEKVPFVAVDIPEANELTVHILAAVAQDEAKRISARTTAALAAAKARGTRLGGLHGRSAESFAAQGVKGQKASMVTRAINAAKFHHDILPVIADIQADGTTSANGIASELNRRGFVTRRDGQWSAIQVQRVLASAQSA